MPEWHFVAVGFECSSQVLFDGGNRVPEHAPRGGSDGRPGNGDLSDISTGFPIRNISLDPASSNGVNRAFVKLGNRTKEPRPRYLTRSLF